jgi:hypothetical protein
MSRTVHSRALLLLVAASSALLAAGCGSSSPKVPTPLATELSYFAPGTPFVAAMQTDSKGAAVQNAEGLLGAFPLGKLALPAVESEVLPPNVSYQSDIEPLAGNPIMLGVLDLSGPSSLKRSSFLAVWITRSAAKLDTVISAFGLHETGSDGGAKLYGTGGSATFAVDGATVIFGSSAADVEAALNLHAHGGGISSADYSKAITGLPANAVVHAFGTLSGVLSTPRAAAARSIPWVAAIKSYGAAISASGAGLTVRFRLDTSGKSLSGTELPIAGGTTTPELAGTLPIVVGLRDPAQSFSFLETAAEAADPGEIAGFTRRENAAKRKTGYDVNTFAALLTGDLIVESDLKTTMGRAQVSDPASAARQLAKLPLVAHDLFFHTAKAITRLPGGFYAIKERDGKTIDLGLVGSEFVAGLATPAQLEAFAAAPATPVPGAQGSLAVRVTLLELLKLALKKTPSTLIQSVLSTLGDVTGSASATPGSLAGQLTLGVK